MTKEVKDLEVTQDQEEEVAETQPEPTAKPVDAPVKCGYVVAVKSDGQLDFKVFGENQGIVELLGLHEYAKMQVQRIINLAQESGEVMVLKALNEIAHMLKSQPEQPKIITPTRSNIVTPE